MRTFLASFAICVGIPAALVACRSSDAAPAPSPAPPSSTAAAPGEAPPAPSASTSGPVANVTFPMPQSALDEVLNPDHLPAYDGPTGSLEGTITVKGPPAPDVKVDVTKCPAAMDAYGKLFREGHPDMPGGPRWLADAAVVVVGYKGFYLPEKNEAVKETIGAASCAYPSRTIAVTYGQRIDIANETKLLFAPVIDQESTPAVMVAPPGGSGDPVRVYPRRAGYFNLTDRIQLFVREDLYVFRHPLHAVTDTSGHYRIDGIPVGKLEVGVHHPTVDADAKKPIEVVAGLVQRVDLELTYKPKAPAKVVDAGLPPKRLQND